MDTIDHAKAARVWERVRSDTPPSPEQGLTELIAGEWTDAAVYLQLSRRFQGKDSATVGRCKALPDTNPGPPTRSTGRSLPGWRSRSAPTATVCWSCWAG